jgi:hypothetical protein
MDAEELEIHRESTVRAINRHVAERFHENGPTWVKAWYSLSLDWSETSPYYVVLPRRSIPKLVDQARRDHDVFRLASFVVGTRIVASAALPDELQTFAAEYLMGELHPPPKKPGRPKTNTWGRDFILLTEMYDLERTLGLPVTQNRERSRQRRDVSSISEIVEEAVRVSLLPNLSRTQIEKIWERRRDNEEYWEVLKLRNFSLLDTANGIERI